MQSSCNKSYLRTSHFYAKCQYHFFALIFLYTLEKNPAEKLCRVFKMELKTYTPVGLKLVLEKNKFKLLHYIQHDFILNIQDSVNIRLACSKVLLLTISFSNIITYSNGYIKGCSTPSLMPCLHKKTLSAKWKTVLGQSSPNSFGGKVCKKS